MPHNLIDKNKDTFFKILLIMVSCANFDIIKRYKSRVKSLKNIILIINLIINNFYKRRK